MRRLGLLCTLALAACAAPYREAYDAASDRLRQFASWRELPEGSADELRVRLLVDGRAALPDEEALDLSAGVDLDAATRAATEANAELRAAVARARAAIEAIPPAAYPDPPRFDLSPEFGLSAEISGLREVGSMLMQMFPVPGRLDTQVAEAVAMAHETIAMAAEMENQVRAEVAAAAADLYAVDRAREVNDASIASVDGIVESVDAAYRTGRVGQQDLLRAQLRRQELSLRALELERMRREAAAMLNEQVDRPAGLPVGPARIPDALPDVPDLDALLGRLDGTRPDLAAAERALDASLARMRLAELGRRLEVGAGAGPMVDLPRGEDAMWSLDTILSFPLKFLQPDRYRAYVEGARAGVAAAAEDYRARRQRARREVVAAHATLAEAARSAQMLDEELVPTARQTLEAARAAYTTGQIDLDTLLAAQIELQDFEERLARRRADALRARAELRRAAGEVTP